MRHHLAQVMHREARKSRRIDIETSALDNCYESMRAT